MKLFLTAIFIIVSFVAISQSTFHKTYDLHGDTYEDGHDIHILEDGLLILGVGDCSGEACTIFMKTDFFGDTLWVRKYTDFSGLMRRTIIHDSILYMPGEIRFSDGTKERDGFRLYKFDLEGNMLDSRKYDISEMDNPEVDTIRRHAAFGAIVVDDKIAVYGEIYELNYNQTIEIFNRGLVVYYNMDLSLDTMFIIQPRYEEIDLWDAHLDPDGLLTFLITDDTLVNGVDIPYRRFEKYDSDGHKLWATDPFRINHSSLNFLASTILSNGDMIMYYHNDSTLVKSDELVTFDSAGAISWVHRVDPNLDIDRRDVSDIHEALDGHILVCGSYEDETNEREGAYVAKHDRVTGELLWERVFQDWTDSLRLESLGLPANDFFRRMMVRDIDGKIAVVGNRSRELKDGGFDTDVLVALLDSDGCLSPDCGGFEQTAAGTPEYYHMFYNGALWYHQDPSAEESIFKIVYRNGSNTEDGIFQMGTRDWRIDPKDFQGGYTSGVEYFKIKNEGRQIYQIVEEVDTMLLYDFTLDIGDMFESEYTPHTLRVIASDTILLINGAKRRTWTLASEDYLENTLTWIEGIGTHYGMLWPKNYPTGDYGDIKLSCYYVYERLHYMNPEFDDCITPLSSTDELAFIELSAIKVFPNPAQDRLMVSVPPELLVERIELMNAQGRTLAQSHDQTSEVRLDLSGNPSGIYYVSIYTDKGTVVKKLVVK